MIFGQASEFAIEAYHEPAGPQWNGFGRMAIIIQGMQLGNIREEHCSLFDATDRFRELCSIIDTLWDESFTGLSDSDIFQIIDRARYTGYLPDLSERYGRFDFLTNTGEQFNGIKVFIICRPGGLVHVLYQFRNNVFGSGSCSVGLFRDVSTSFVCWFDKQVSS